MKSKVTLFIDKYMAIKELSELENIIRTIEVHIYPCIPLVLVTAIKNPIISS